MQLHEIKLNVKTKKHQRVGRGGKRGTYSGKGMKGQKSRSGHKMRPALRDLLIRIPKLKGIKNKSLVSQTIAVNLNRLNNVEGNLITRETLIQGGVIRKSDKIIKILSNGEISRAITVKGIGMSQKAKEKIESAGGIIEL